MSEPAFDRDEVAGLAEGATWDGGQRPGPDRREVGDFSKVVSTAGVAAAVGLGVVGCAYPVHQRASGRLVVETRRIQLRTRIDRGAAVRLASEVQRSTTSWPAMHCRFFETMLVASGG